ncbi:MAG: hypothetical protein ACOYNC_16905 [Bacteroidales bacterium]
MNKMKNVTIMIAFLFSTVALFAQDSPSKKESSGDFEMKTIFGNEHGHLKIPIGYFVELNAGYTQFGDKSVFLPGISTGMILNHHWTIGLAGSFIGNSRNLHYPDVYFDSAVGSMAAANLAGGYGGLLLEYTLFPTSAVHLSFPVMIGGGYMFYGQPHQHNSSTYPNNDWNGGEISHDHFFVVEPGVKVEMNVIKKMRIGVGVSYRYSPDFKLPNTSTELINQFTAKLSLRFGKF